MTCNRTQHCLITLNLLTASWFQMVQTRYQVVDLSSGNWEVLGWWPETHSSLCWSWSVKKLIKLIYFISNYMTDFWLAKISCLSCKTINQNNILLQNKLFTDTTNKGIHSDFWCTSNVKFVLYFTRQWIQGNFGGESSNVSEVALAIFPDQSTH